MQDFANRIDYACKAVGNAGILAELTGISERAISKYRNGETDPSRANLVLIANAAKIDIGWLASGKGDLSLNVKSHDSEYVSVPIMHAKASAGDGVLAENEGATDFIKFSKHWLTSTYFVNPADVFLMQTEGDSMIPTIMAGEIILIKKYRQNGKPSDGIYVVRIEGAVNVKRLQFLPGNIVRVSSDNQAYAPYDLELNDGLDFQLIGRVLSCIRTI